MSTDIASYEVGEKLGGYTVDRKESLDHLHGTYYELSHAKTGARHIHVALPDDNNTYIALFPTVPKDSTGVAHILEHVVLTGSERFPIRDPFFSMGPRSLKTFMNALTSSDWTAYPFSTRNTKDFFNLLEVYLDATFFPNLDEDSFKQEGHRFEFESLEDLGSGLRYKGVVFNEMKAQQSTPPYVAHLAVGKALFPDLTYANQSGGNPEVMPSLTYEQLKGFHATHYHPSNCFFFTYGDIPLADTLSKVESLALDRFDKITPDVDIPDQKRFNEPVVFEDFYPLSKEEDTKKKAQVFISWTTTHVGDSFEVTALNILSEYLLGNPASPLRKALIESGIGDALSDISGFSPNYREAIFSAGLKGVDPEDADKVEKIVLDTLNDVATSGADPEDIDAAIHQFEIDQREVSNAAYPYSLKVFFTLAGAYIYGGDPHKMLQFDEHFSRIRAEREKGPYFENLIRKYLIDNTHRAKIVIKPDQELEESREKDELDRLAKIEGDLTEDQKAKIVEDARRLQDAQEADEDRSSLPNLELSDVPMSFPEVPHEIVDVGGNKIGLFPQPTNGLTYVDLRTSFETLPNDLKDYMTLFAYALPKMGAGDLDYVGMARRIAASTGGISANASIRTQATGDAFNQSFTIGGKALARNHQAFIDIYKDFLTSVKFDPKRLKEVLTELRSRYEASVVSNGHMYSNHLAASKLKVQQALDERLSGLTQLALLKNLTEEGSIDDVISKLEAIKDHLFRSGNFAVCVTSEEGELDSLKSMLEGPLGALQPAEASKGSEIPAELKLKHEAKTTAAPVAFNAKVYKAVGYTHPDAPALAVLARFLNPPGYLHREIREKGGAYGGGALFSAENGLFSFYSYRDPHIVRTFQIYESAVSEITKGELEDDKVAEAVLGTCGSVDPLESPDTKGRRRFYDDRAGYSLELRSNYKKGLLEVTADDLRRVAETYLTGNDASLATISGPEKIAEANKEMGNIFEVSPI